MLTKKHLDRLFQKLPICNRSRTRSGWVEPEVYFRVVHVAEGGHPGAPVADYGELTVETAHGPKGTFEYGGVGALRLRAPSSRPG